MSKMSDLQAFLNDFCQQLTLIESGRSLTTLVIRVRMDIFFFEKTVANLDLDPYIHILQYDNRKKRIFESHYFAVMAEDTPVSPSV